MELVFPRACVALCSALRSRILRDLQAGRQNKTQYKNFEVAIDRAVNSTRRLAEPKTQ